MKKKKKKSFKSIIITTIIILIVTNTIISVSDCLTSMSKRCYSSNNWHWYGYVYYPEYKANRTFACLSNIRVLLAAVEFYNMEHEHNFMTELDTDKLVAEGYLKSEIRPPESKCKYFITEDLSSEDPIGCEFHGTESEIRQKLEKEKREFERNITIYNVSIRLLPALLYFIYAITFLAI